ncbi:hypothetical protein EJB05_55039, partial [Eragrostis curvula]
MDVIETEEELRLALADMKKRHSFLAVLLTSLSALCSESKTCYELKSSAADEANAILYALLCCSVLQAAAAVLALLLTGRRRRALAYFTLAATAVGHCMYARIQCPRLDAYRNIDGVRLTLLFFNLGNDLLCFHLLIKVRAYEVYEHGESPPSPCTRGRKEEDRVPADGADDGKEQGEVSAVLGVELQA